MKPGSLRQTLLILLAAIGLVAVLAFLYQKTQATDIREQNDGLNRLRELRDIDTRWDTDVLRAGAERELGAVPLVDSRSALESTLRRLADTARSASSTALSADLFEVSLAVRKKAQLIEAFRAENGQSRTALDELARARPLLATANAEQKVPLAAVDAMAARLEAAGIAAYGQPSTANVKELEAAVGELQTLQAGLPEALKAPAMQVLQAGLTLAKSRSDELRLRGLIAELGTGPRINNITLSLNRELEASLQEKEVYRAYLIGYAGALLILLGWLMAKLRAANVSLERRVEERTRELSDALLHLKESEAQLIQSEKMSSLGQMVAGVAHEINTPLAYVKNSLGTVAEKLPELDTALSGSERLLALLQAGADANPEELSRQFGVVSQQLASLKQRAVVKELVSLVGDGVYGTTQMAEIVGNLKDFSRLDRSKVTQFNLNEGLTSTLLLAKHLLKSVKVEKQFGQIPAILCSPSQINQVFLNLITNAAQAMESGADAAAGIGTITLTTRSDGTHVIAEVADTGKGIPADVMPKIFDPFFSTKEIGKGTGLGLSISYKIVQQHGGRIDVASEPGKGTRFTVTLPLTPPADAGLDA